jgi:hypothetical protein
MALEAKRLIEGGESFKKARNKIVTEKRLKPEEVKKLNESLHRLNLHLAKRYLAVSNN